MDILQAAADEYSKYINKNVKVTFSNGDTIRIVFKPGNFMHLSGIHKLQDLYFVSSPDYSSKSIYKMARSGELISDDLNNSVFYNSDAQERIICLSRMSELLAVGGSAIYGFNKNACRIRVSFKSTIMFFKHDGRDFYLTFGIAMDRDGVYYYPETVFYRFDNAYISGQKIVKITDVVVENHIDKGKGGD